ncbi:MAG TPA: HAMP domain-containing sensor histidine kinase [Polyangiaceae bacterium]|nr:HAMP domain-containing sensor histidine kinase [Polyangiaceae bacterium]
MSSNARIDLESWLELHDAPVLLCDDLGRVCMATPEALALLPELERAANSSEAVLPMAAIRAIREQPFGTPWLWPTSETGLGISCVAFEAGADRVLLLFRTDASHASVERRLHRQRLELTGQLTASVAHDLRSAVASIVYNSDALIAEDRGAEESVPPELLRETLLDLRAASARLQFAVDGLLHFVRGGPRVCLDVRLEEVFGRARNFVRWVYRERGHSLEFSIAEGAESVRGSPVLIEQILVNLLLNAAEAASTGLHVTVSAKPPPAGEGHVRIRVADDGPGIPEEIRERIFLPFFSTKRSGSGLGLSTARSAARELEGQLELVPRERGACFEITLPKVMATKTLEGVE